MKNILFLAAALLLAPLGSLRAAPPNIIYILADDLGYGDVQCLNPQRGKIKTPNLDKLASQGMTFTDAHSGSSVCTPTRYGLLTGRYAWRSRLQSGVLDGTDDPALIAADRLTLPALLKQQGYTTAILGKWHLGFLSKLPENAPPSERKAKKKDGGGGGLPVGASVIDGPITRGFDYFWGCSNARTITGLIENDKVIENIAPITMLPRLGQRAVDYISDHAAAAKSGKSFFLYLPLTSPHTPILPSPEWQGKSGLGDYGDFVMQTDAVVGAVLAELDKQQLAENTLVIFTSDNGCSKAADFANLERQGHHASADLRGSKADIWDGGHRVPFFVRWPGKVAAASQSSQLICHTDFIATCAEILGATLPENAAEDSFSILPALLGTAKNPVHETVIHHSINGSFAIRQGKWKLELCADSGGWTAPKPGSAESKRLPENQLYDLTIDKAESKNLAAEYPAEVTRLAKLLDEAIANGRTNPGPKQKNDVSIQVRKKARKQTENSG
jgi:arylsulfatase A-like enzyme